MKILHYITLLFLFIILFSACKTSDTSDTRSFYASINKDYAGAVSIGKARAAEEAKLARTAKEKADRKAEKEVGKRQTTESSVHVVVNVKPVGIVTEAQPIVSLEPVVSATPTTEEVLSSDTKALDLKMLESKERESKVTIAKTKAESDELKNVVRKGRIMPEEGYEDKLKKYSVVIATLAKKSGVERLKVSFELSNEPFIVAKTKNGMSYFILGSYDNQDEAVVKRAEVRKKYVNSYSKKELLKQYGIPFSDVWIVVNE